MERQIQDLLRLIQSAPPPKKPTNHSLNLEKSTAEPTAAQQIIQRIQNTLITNNTVDQVELMTVDIPRHPGEYVKRVVSDCLPTNQPIPVYRQISDTIKQTTNLKIALIVPGEGDRVDRYFHNVVGQRPVSKGAVGAVVELVLPGVCCDNKVLKRAMVTESI